MKVQVAVGALREASIVVVEAVQSWRTAQAAAVEQESVSKDRTRLAKMRESEHRGPESEGAACQQRKTRVSASAIVTNEETLSDREGCLPEVLSPQARPATIPSPVPNAGQDISSLPTYWWVPPGDNTGKKKCNNLCNTRIRADQLDQCEVGFYEGGSKAADHAPRSAEPTVEYALGHDIGGCTNISTVGTFGVNYLAKMVHDTDFIGAFGSALASIFPPDTKLFRNPFVLAHNLDDTMAAFADTMSWGAARSSGSPRRSEIERDGARDTGRGGSGADQRSIARMDTKRMRHASVVIVAEENKEKVRLAKIEHWPGRRCRGRCDHRAKRSKCTPWRRVAQPISVRAHSRASNNNSTRDPSPGG